MRKLASIQIINNILPIEGSDFIEQIQVKGWILVAKKGEFNINGKCIYIEIDSVVKECPEFEFLRGYKFRVKTQKIRGVISQGLSIPLKTFNIPENTPIDTNVTDLLGITKYLSPSEREEISQQERVKHWTKNYKITKWLWRYSWFRNYIKPIKIKWWPEWISHTNEERIQNIPYVLQQFADKEVYVTEKIDYQSVTFTGKMIPKYSGLLGKLIPKKKYKFIVCSRNMTTNNKNSLYWKIAEKYNIEQILRENPNLTIQGEQGDTKVQGNKYGITEPTMWVFNIIDHERNYHFDRLELKYFCEKYNLPTVPMLQIGSRLEELGSTVQEIVEFSKGKSVINPKVEREGIVVRCVEHGQKLMSFKAINPNFLLKYSDE